MIVVLDTNALIKIFGGSSPCRPILEALRRGSLEIAVSTAILLEYEEVIVRYAGTASWHTLWTSLLLFDQLYGNVRQFAPSYHFKTIINDPDDDAFADCGIAAGAEYIITSDHHFDVLIGSGYRPQPITPEDFIRRHLVSA